MNEPVNPVEVEAAILAVAAEIEKGVEIVSQWEEQAKDTAEDARRAFNNAYLEAKGTPSEKRIRAEIATADLRTAAQVAGVGFSTTERRLKSLEKRLSAYQSVLKSVTQMYGATGPGRGH